MNALASHYFIIAWILFLVVGGNVPVSARADDPLFELRSVTRTPLTRAVSGGMVSVRVIVVNRSPEVVRARLSGRVDGFTDQEQVRDVEVAAKTECHFDMLINVPLETRGRERIDIVIDAMQDRDGTYYQFDLDGKPMSQSLPLMLDSAPVFPAMIINPFPLEKPFWHWPPLEPFYPFEHIKATCVDSGLSIRTANFDVYPLPTSYLGWDAIDWLVVGESRTLQDASTTESIKRFVQSGGSLWIMLDQVSTEQLRPFLSGRQMCETVGETELTNFVVDVVSKTTSFAETDRTVVLREPVKMKWVAVEGAEITHRVDDWPLAFRMRCGHGYLYFTTIGSQAWLRERTGDRPFDTSLTSDFQSQIWSIDWAREVSNVRRFQPLSTDETNYALGLIGSPVPSRSLISMLLSSFCLVLLGLGVWKFMAGDLKQIGIFVPMVSGLVALGIILGAFWIKREIKQTDARLQIVEVTEDGSNAFVREHGAIYQRDSSDMKLMGQMNGSGTPDASVTSGIKTLAFRDVMNWSMENTAWPPGIWKYSTSGLMETDSLRVLGRLTKKGLEIETPASLNLSDIVVNFVPGNRMIGSKEGDRITADGELKAAGDRWFVDTLVTNEQTRRAEVYRNYFRLREQETRLPRRLLGWSDRWKDLSEWNRDDLDLAGAALVSLPIQLAPPDPNQTILVPHGLVTIQNSRDSISSSTAFDQARGEWIAEATYAAELDLEFLLPQEVLPFSAEQVEFELDVRAPQRKVTVFHGSESGFKELASIDGPSVPWRLTLTDDPFLNDCRDGVVRIKLVVGERAAAAANSGSISLVGWQVSHFHLSFRGRVANETDGAAERVGGL